ncbi:MAG: VTT domain-containing protein [Oscillospiraceae bacterium]|nr:VTT domain-containing protein [Oscillospiraceae bacterium]
MKLKRKLEKRDYINLAVIAIIIICFIFAGVKYRQAYSGIKGEDFFSSAENLKELILSFGISGQILVFALHALQVIVSVIPTLVLQFSGSLIYGFAGGMALGFGGILAGTAVSFYLSKLLGRRIVTLLVSEKNIGKIEKVINGGISALALAALFIFPFPKAYIGYFIGLTGMKAPKFFLIAMLGRLPGMAITSFLGANILGRNYAAMAAVIITAVILSSALYLFKDKFLAGIKKNA